MQINKLLRVFGLVVLSFFALLGTVHAHEAYVIEDGGFWTMLEQKANLGSFAALRDPHNLRIAIGAAMFALVLITLNFMFRRSKSGQRFTKWIEGYAHFGPQFVRFSVAAALLVGAMHNSFLGPELDFTAIPHYGFIQIMLICAGVMILFGIFTEVAGVIAMSVMVLYFVKFGHYVFSYFNYFGEFLVLILFGMRVFSVDKHIFGRLGYMKHFEKYETLITRVTYGIALVYTAVTVKLLHPEITEHVVSYWHINDFNWLFPSDPTLVTLGAAIVEIVLGLFIILGFELRLFVLISLFYLTLSLIYFREMVWPHLLLYGLSFNLLVQPEMFTIDHLIFGHHRRAKRWWHRPITPHNNRGKSDPDNPPQTQNSVV